MPLIREIMEKDGRGNGTAGGHTSTTELALTIILLLMFSGKLNIPELVMFRQ